MYYKHVLLPALEQVVRPFDPWTIGVEVDLLSLSPEEAVEVVGRRNAAAIRDSALLVAVLDGQELDGGTASEVGYASAKGATCFGLRTDLRATGDLGAVVNVQVEWFIRSSGGKIARSLDELLAALRSIDSE